MRPKFAARLSRSLFNLERGARTIPQLSPLRGTRAILATGKSRFKWLAQKRKTSSAAFPYQDAMTLLRSTVLVVALFVRLSSVALLLRTGVGLKARPSVIPCYASNSASVCLCHPMGQKGRQKRKRSAYRRIIYLEQAIASPSPVGFTLCCSVSGDDHAQVSEQPNNPKEADRVFFSCWVYFMLYCFPSVC